MEAVQVGDQEIDQTLSRAAQVGDQEIDQTLSRAAQGGDIGAFYALIPSNPRLLEQMDEKPFVDTPLHAAARAGQTQFAMEMMRLKPSFARKPNHSGFSPMHLALENGHTPLVRRLVDVDPNLVRVKGREGITPLHHVAKTGDVNLLAEFLVVCPKSIEDLTIRRETALHVAMKNRKFEAVKVLVGWIQRKLHGGAPEFRQKVLNWKDDEGDTILHIATNWKDEEGDTATTSNIDRFQVVKWLLTKGVDVNSKNLTNRTALDIIKEEQLDARNAQILQMLHRSGALRSSSLPRTDTRADHLSSGLSNFDRFLIFIMRKEIYMTSDNRNALLVVAVLMVTATYQTGINPPGGVWKDDYTPPNYLNTSQINITEQINTTATMAFDTSNPPPHDVGTTVLGPVTYSIFTFYNSTVLWTSVTIIFILLPRGTFAYVLLLPPLSVFLFCHFISVVVISGGGAVLLYFLAYAFLYLLLISAVIWLGDVRAGQLKDLLVHQTLSR